MEVDNIQIQPLRALSEMHDVVELQKTYWGDDAESVIPAHMLFSLASNGGHVLVATDGDIYAGAVIGFLGTNMEMTDRPAAANLHVYSKRMIVSRDYRNHGLGYRLKMAQRDYAIKQGIDLVVWTFDPLLAMNAYLNLRKLGGISRSYRENYYGVDNTGGLSPMGASDRLYLEWPVTRDRVNRRADGTHKDRSLQEYMDLGAVLINPALLREDGLAVPAEQLNPVEGKPFVLVEIPVNYYDVMKNDEDLSLKWRAHNREALESLVARGYTVTDFLREEYEGHTRAMYVLSLSDELD